MYIYTIHGAYGNEEFSPGSCVDFSFQTGSAFGPHRGDRKESDRLQRVVSLVDARVGVKASDEAWDIEIYRDGWGEFKDLVILDDFGDFQTYLDVDEYS